MKLLNMLASLLRPKARRGQIDESQFSSPFTARDHSPWFGARRGLRNTRGADSSDDEPELEDIDEDMGGHWERDEEEEDDGPIESTPLLPIFSSSHLGTTFDPARRVTPLTDIHTYM